ncbi:MAG: sigma 54-interacting transcriptional regulator [Eubacteriales bacterium]
MLKRKISLLTIDEEIALFFKKELKEIFGSTLEINYYTPSSTQQEKIYQSDLILYTDPSILIELMDIIKCSCPILMMKRTISKSAVEKIQKIPKNSKCLVANINSFMANETLAIIYQLGFKDITLIPFYPDLDDIPKNTDYIVTHEKYDYLDTASGKVIDIGNRIFDINTVLDILSILDIDSSTSEKIILEYSLKIPNLWKGVNYTLENKRILSSQWRILLDELSEGVMIIDDKNRITLLNDTFKSIIGEKEFEFEGITLSKLKSYYPNLGILKKDSEIEDELFVYNEKKLILTMKKVSFNNSYYGKIVLIKNYKDVVEIQQKIHKEIIGKGYYSKYTFHSIVCNNEKIIELKKISKKIANSNNSILISGDSGTGKELFAGSIHNFSNRKKKPFVAVNCAAIPENLLESELFGHEEGSFTGAKKGGKIGLFESADGGTLFLDEIGELPLNLQGRLLRVLQEKEIMRVGGDSIIKINTRIITATNKNLWDMVEEGNFRKDLFFRLNVFNLEIPSLKDRKEDISLLTDYYINKSSRKIFPTLSFKAFAKNYYWPGNVRELFNVLEYMSTVSKDNLYISNLPSYLKKQKYMNFKIKELGLNSTKFFTLRVISYLNKNNKNSGRRSIKDQFEKKYIPLSEMEIRKKIDFLENQGYIKVYKGPKGCLVTKEGSQKLNENLNN